jgi:hypothetical protein
MTDEDDCDYNPCSSDRNKHGNDTTFFNFSNDYTAFCFGDFFMITCSWPEKELVVPSKLRKCEDIHNTSVAKGKEKRTSSCATKSK